MKEHYNVEISDIHLTIVSDEPEEFVNSTVAKISERVNDLIVHNKRCSKLDAALLCALDYCGEYTKAERRIRNLEAQISLYDANLKRMREEIAQKGEAPESVKSALGVAAKSDEGDGPTQKSAENTAPSAPSAPKSASKSDTVSMLEDRETSAQPSESADDEDAQKKAKMAQIEKLLRK